MSEQDKAVISVGSTEGHCSSSENISALSLSWPIRKKESFLSTCSLEAWCQQK